jgi:NO-binding membrane sensor protein with MHYT domain
VITVHNFSGGLLNPALGYAMAVLGAFLGLRCVTRARAHEGTARGRWLISAAVAIGATSIWGMHFIAMLGFTIPGESIRYNVPITILSMLVAVVVVAVGLFIVGYREEGPIPLLAGGVIIGFGVAIMHYVGMAAMSMPAVVHYNNFLVAVSVLIAVVAGTAGLWAGLRVKGVWSTLAAALIFGVAVTGMHYTGMAAMRVSAPTGMGSMAGGDTAASFLLPLILGLSLVSFLLALIITLSPTEDEIHADAQLMRRIGQRG